MRKDERVIAFSKLITSVRFVSLPSTQTPSYVHFFPPVITAFISHFGAVSNTLMLKKYTVISPYSRGHVSDIRDKVVVSDK
jgi:hypothetical protein